MKELEPSTAQVVGKWERGEAGFFSYSWGGGGEGGGRGKHVLLNSKEERKVILSYPPLGILSSNT